MKQSFKQKASPRISSSSSTSLLLSGLTPSQSPMTESATPQHNFSVPGSRNTSTTNSTNNVKVIVRLRPFLENESTTNDTMVHIKHNIVSLMTTTVGNTGQKAKHDIQSYEFDSAYGLDAKQEEIFEKEIIPAFPNVFKGINLTVFAYGQTGSGKTFTMQGIKDSPELLGIIPRTVKTIFDMSADHKKHNPGDKIIIEASYFEIYNEKLFDLLEIKETEIQIRQDPNNNIFIKDLKLIPLRDVSHFDQIYEMGCKNRKVASTNLNSHSSRSHAIFTLTVKSTKFNSKIHLIDLAGSEDNRKTGNQGIRLKESSNINLSLFVLKKVVDALNNQSKKSSSSSSLNASSNSSSSSENRIPYRDSKLTRFLQDSLGGTAKAILITNISPLKDHYSETLNTLNFAMKSKKIVNNTVSHMNEFMPNLESERILALEKEISELRKQKEENSKNDEDSNFQTPSKLKKPNSSENSSTFDLILQKIPGILSPVLRKHGIMSQEITDRLASVEKYLLNPNSQLPINSDVPISNNSSSTPNISEYLEALTPKSKKRTAKFFLKQAKTLLSEKKRRQALFCLHEASKMLPNNEKLNSKIVKFEEEEKQEAQALSAAAAAKENEKLKILKPKPKPNSNKNDKKSNTKNFAVFQDENNEETTQPQPTNKKRFNLPISDSVNSNLENVDNKPTTTTGLSLLDERRAARKRKLNDMMGNQMINQIHINQKTITSTSNDKKPVSAIDPIDKENIVTVCEDVTLRPAKRRRHV